MLDVLDDLLRWWNDGQPVGVATVVSTWRSAPRLPGATMLAGPDGTAVGSLSGGCVEGTVYELAREAAETGISGLHRFGVSDDDAFAVGLTCGGTLEVFVERVDRATFPQLGSVAAAIRAGARVAVATTVSGPPRRAVIWPRHTDGDPGHGEAVRAMWQQGRTGLVEQDGTQVFVASYQPPPRLIIFGATDFAAALARVGKILGYRTTVCDARPLFATERRMPGADEVAVDWPHRYLEAEAEAGRIDERTAICVLTHDPKFDIPALRVALRLPVAYVGAMGSRRTHDQRLERLRDSGVPAEHLARLSSPVGLDLDPRTPEETAVSIGAELLLLRSGRSGRRLSHTSGPIHHPAAP
ncbi:XdhC family protein [Actinoplanes sp. NPDC048988]|uniref:XdhC family protein n=1 Tax=Actinoplanes sp. NPDC048988 TaxID=3363901 RepID=UPI00372223FE